MHPPLLSSFGFRDIDHAIAGLDVTWLNVEQLVNSNTCSPKHPQHEVVSLATLACRLEYLIDLLFFQVVGDVLH